jgi:poly(beta-D-mannuronate) lyase
LKYYLFVIIVLVSSFQLIARKTTVTTASAINNGSWVAGDTIMMKNGAWTNQSISFKATGTALNPVVLEAETPGNVILNGSSKLAFGGNYIVISGLYFLNGNLSGSDVISFRSSENANNSTLKNTVIANYNPSLNTVDSKWVSIYGTNNTVDHCSFENKNNSGTLLVVWLTSGVTVNHRITNNYFGYRNSNLDINGDELNGQEIIRVGDSSTSMTFANCNVTGNFFEKCNGEIEVISNKSCGNLYSNNLFLECKGMLTLRHGNNCSVAGNYFFGNGVSDSGGVRIIGENHKVYNNYFENLRGTGYRAALCMVRGKQNSALNEYYQVKNALVAFNTMINCSQSFSINYNSSSTITLPPINSVIAHNHIYNTSSSYTNVVIDQNFVSAMSLTWKNNLMNQGKYTDFSYNSTQVITNVDAKMSQVATAISMYEPNSNSLLANYKTAEYSEVSVDIRGRSREINSKFPGSSETSGTVSSNMPVKKLVGAGFFNNPSTLFNPQKMNNPFIYSSLTGTIQLKSNVAGDICIYNLKGEMLYKKNVFAHSVVDNNLLRGIYVIRFKTKNGQIFNDIITVI